MKGQWYRLVHAEVVSASPNTAMFMHGDLIGTLIPRGALSDVWACSLAIRHGLEQEGVRWEGF